MFIPLTQSIFCEECREFLDFVHREEEQEYTCQKRGKTVTYLAKFYQCPNCDFSCSDPEYDTTRALSEELNK